MVLQVYYAVRVRRSRSKAVNGGQQQGEGWILGGLRGLRSLLFFCFLGLYAFGFPWVDAGSINLPGWLSWMGVALGIGSLVLYAWSRQSLGVAWSSRLGVRKEHKLVAHGPYTRVRHPIYLALLSFLASLALMVPNWVLVAIWVFSWVDLMRRISREEAMMTQVFGDEYRSYQERTGRFFPNL